MGEILRSVIDQQALIARPRFYVSIIPMAAYTAGQEITGHIRIQQNTQFLWTSFGFQEHSLVDGVPGTSFGSKSQIVFRDFASGKLYSNAPNIAGLFGTYPFGQTEQEEYPLLPGDYRLGWSVTPQIVHEMDSYYLMFAGIEYVMPGSNAAYGIPQLGG